MAKVLANTAQKAGLERVRFGDDERRYSWLCQTMLKIHPKFWDVWIYRDPASSSLDLGSPQRRIPEGEKNLTWQQSSMTFLRILCLPMALASGFVLALVSGAMRGLMPFQR
ncbi:hypothetical protein N7504_004565 [Penicillium tannophilum]|nr:hypothetical protein N7504_004565 [Penicillium tannophilum]